MQEVFRLVPGRLTATLAALLLLAGGVGPGQVSTAAAVSRAPAYPSLLDARDPALQAAVERMIVDLRLSRAVARHQLEFTLVDITDPARPRLADVNGDVMMYAASLPKIAILFGAFQRAEDAQLVLTDHVREDLTAMIRYSSNTAATRMLNLVGKDYLARLLQSDRYKFYDSEHDGGLWVGKEYAKAGAWRRDPLHNISHGATSNQVARFFYLLETGHLVSPAASEQMKDILSRPGIDHKFVRALRQARPGSEIFRKSGSWRDYHCDGAIVERDGRRYIAVVLARHAEANLWISQLIVRMDDLIFDPRLQRPVDSLLAHSRPAR